MADLSLVTKAIYQALTGNAQLVAGLPVYRGSPAIFSGFLVPPDAPLPRVVISLDPVSDESQDDVTAFQREQVRDIFIYAGRGTTGVASEQPIAVLAEQVRSALHLNYLAVAGWTCNLAHASGPKVAPTDETVVGRVVTLRYSFCEA